MRSASSLDEVPNLSLLLHPLRGVQIRRLINNSLKLGHKRWKLAGRIFNDIITMKGTNRETKLICISAQ